MGNLFAIWWGINPVLTIIIIGGVLWFVGGMIYVVISALFKGDSSKGSGVSYKEPTREEIAERKREEKELREKQLAEYFQQKELEHENKLRNAKCLRCTYCVTEFGSDHSELYYWCNRDGHIIKETEKSPHYCKEFSPW